MYLDYKCTVWRRIHIPDDKNDKGYILEKLKKGRTKIPLCRSGNDMTVEENGGSSTIELFDEDKLIFKNGE